MANRKVGMFGVEPNEYIDERSEDGVAALLRRRREELGRDIPTVARQLRIRAVYISAIEDGRLQDLPGTAYAVGFVRAYADYLGLDGNSVVGDYRDELARRSRQNQLIWPVDQVEHKHFPGGAVLVVSLLVLGALVGGWYMASQPGGTGIDLIDQVPEFMKKQTGSGEEAPATQEGQSGAAVPASDVGSTPASAQAAQTPTQAPAEIPAIQQPAPAAASAPAEAVTVPAADATAPQAGAAQTSAPAETPAVPAPVASIAAAPAATPATIPVATPAETAVPAAAPAAQPAAAPVPEAQPASAQPAASNVPAAPAQTAAAPVDEAEVPAVATPEMAAAPATPGKRVVLRATKDSWVEIFDANDAVVLQRILRAGETFAVPDQAGLTMNTGNAGGVVIEVNGKAQPALGSVGVVKRGVKLDDVSQRSQ